MTSSEMELTKTVMVLTVLMLTVMATPQQLSVATTATTGMRQSFLSRDAYGDGIDQSCSGFDGIDSDGDGYASGLFGGSEL